MGGKGPPSCLSLESHLMGGNGPQLGLTGGPLVLLFLPSKNEEQLLVAGSLDDSATQPRVNTQSATTSRQQHLASPRITRTSASPGLVQFPAMCSLSPSGDDGGGFSDDSRMGEDSDDHCTSWLGAPVRGAFVWPLDMTLAISHHAETQPRINFPSVCCLSNQGRTPPSLRAPSC